MSIYIGTRGGIAVGLGTGGGSTLNPADFASSDEFANDAVTVVLKDEDGTELWKVDQPGHGWLVGHQVLYDASLNGFIGTIYYGNGGSSLQADGSTGGQFNTGVGIGALAANSPRS